MTQQEYESLPDAQRAAMWQLHERSGIPWEAFLEQAYPPTPLDPYVAIPNFHGMYVGIERDGYTHS